MPLAQCALCRQSANLQDSHLMPRGLYKLLTEPDREFRHPMLVTASTTVQTPAQVHDYLLCKNCELRFQQQAEDWVMKNGPHRNGRFPLREALLRSPINSTIASGVIYKEEFDAAFDLERLIYFATSVFWSSSVHHWNRSQHLMTRAQLPPEIEEQLRVFLLHEQGFPADLVLLISVTATAVLPHITFPTPMIRVSPSAPAIDGYGFAIPGLQFRLIYGNVPEYMKRVSVAVPPHAILVTDRVEQEIRASAEHLRETSKVVGALAGRT
jgi:hypothetical protein